MIFPPKNIEVLRDKISTLEDEISYVRNYFAHSEIVTSLIRDLEIELAKVQTEYLSECRKEFIHL